MSVSTCSGSQIFTDPTCSAWAKANTSQAIPIKMQVCANMNNCTCRNWAVSAEAMGNIDSIMTPFCAANPNDPLCTCINSPFVAINGCPNKFDKKCVATGYETSSMIKSQCPNIINCNQQVNLTPAQLSLMVDSTVNLSCGGGTNAVVSNTGGSTSKTTSVGSASGGTGSSTFSTTDIMYIVALIFLILIVVIAISIVAYKKSHNSKKI